MSHDADEQLARQLQEEENRAAGQGQVLPPSMLGSMQDGLQCARRCEDELVQAMAFSVLPMEQLQAQASEAVEVSSAMGEDPAVALPDALAETLLAWFKLSFFSWVDKLPCERCGNGNTQNVGIETLRPGAPNCSFPPRSEELQGGAQRVELYRCDHCVPAHISRFPRYNDPQALLDSRKGRCGEWAKCFGLCCRAAGLDVRWIYDMSDHTWVEYYSSAMGRWLHMDPCEAAYDKPLLYEQGWGKKLHDVIACHHLGLYDLAAYPGKQSGAADWRQQRGETGASSAAPAKAPATRYVKAHDERVASDRPDRLRGGFVRASGENKPHEGVAKVADGNPHSKWLDFGGANGRETWLEYSLSQQATPVTVTSFELTSANDFPERDPRDFVLEGSTSTADGWRHLAAANNASFLGRHATLSFDVSSSQPCRRWRLRITALRDNSAANCVQLSGFALFAKPAAPNQSPAKISEQRQGLEQEGRWRRAALLSR
ncbi:hypothetical protein WJX73_007396 [Symbiochloris irregularis]|uniref:Peptide-N(4)-(N-acetyl-beta-glucosaminyl)asparagine amidase n=1 Tax=Symbiochloris irregularis TaxID=706552 RepID=A0AAW1NX72_9CHLO